jgi:hypothetical protein
MNMFKEKNPLECAIQHLRNTYEANEARKRGTVFGYESQCLLTGEQTAALLEIIENPTLNRSLSELMTLRDQFSKAVIMKQGLQPSK